MFNCFSRALCARLLLPLAKEGSDCFAGAPSGLWPHAVQCDVFGAIQVPHSGQTVEVNGPDPAGLMVFSIAAMLRKSLG
jgi:hypothetical protein